MVSAPWRSIAHTFLSPAAAGLLGWEPEGRSFSYEAFRFAAGSFV